MANKINWNEMVSFIYQHSDLNLNIDEIEEVLELEEDYLYLKNYNYNLKQDEFVSIPDDTEICDICGNVYTFGWLCDCNIDEEE